MAKQNLGGIYQNMEFTPWVFKEYPKHVPTGPYGQFAVANNAEEEHRILKRVQQDQDDAPALTMPHVRDPEKDILISRAQELQVPFNPKWSKGKLQQLVDEAEEQVDMLPVDESRLHPADFADTVAEKDRLIAEAKALGIPANRIWGIPRLQDVIKRARRKLERASNRHIGKPGDVTLSVLNDDNLPAEVDPLTELFTGQNALATPNT